ncbi:MAG: uroporphyrinogen decarboxylase [Rhizomicrobium sp.]
MLKPAPVWLMRQAGRYLPEYREARAKAGSFWKLCMTPAAAAAVTLQPVERYGLSAAIVFSDILVVPYALGKRVTFEEGTRPRLEPTRSPDELESDPAVWLERLSPAYEALERVAARLDRSRDLIGFAGAPWTLAVYMAEGGAAREQRTASLWGYRDRDGFTRLLDVISNCVAAHLCAQIAAGANVVQIFDSWAGGLSERAFRDWVVAPTKTVVAQVKHEFPDARVIGFPRGATLAGYEQYARETGVDAVSLDTSVPIGWAAETLGGRLALQGNLDPLLLLVGGHAMRDEIDRLLAATAKVPFVANLGHGVLPETPPDNVAEFVARVQAGR